jgi:hypothetical protein
MARVSRRACSLPLHKCPTTPLNVSRRPTRHTFVLVLTCLPTENTTGPCDVGFGFEDGPETRPHVFSHFAGANMMLDAL